MNPQNDDTSYDELEREITALTTRISYPWIKAPKTVRDIPDFPFQSFEELQGAFADRSFSVLVSYTAARELARFTRSNLGRLAHLLVIAAPFEVSLALVVGAILLKNYLILLGIPIVFVSSFLGSPFLPLKGFTTFICWILFGALLLAYSQGYSTVVWLLGSFIVPFWAIREVHQDRGKSIEKAVQDSEPLFVDLYEKRWIRLWDRKTNKFLW